MRCCSAALLQRSAPVRSLARKPRAAGDKTPIRTPIELRSPSSRAPVDAARDFVVSRPNDIVVRLKEGRERSLRKHHPWVFEGAVNKSIAVPESAIPPGALVRLESASSEFLGWAAYNRNSNIRARVWSFSESEGEINETMIKRRIREALAFRSRLGIASNGVRVIHAEADGLPGLVVDKYDDMLCAQFGSAAVDIHKELIADSLLRETGLSHLYERSDTASRKLEGLSETCGWLRGSGATERIVREDKMELSVDVATGHKTGYYLDQRDNRRKFGEWVKGFGVKRVLNCFSYTGGFSVSALLAGAKEVTSVDTSVLALERVQDNMKRNGLNLKKSVTVNEDANAFMRKQLKTKETYDAIVLDPPKYAPTHSHAEKAARLYKDINRIALMLLVPGGLLLTFSCSGGIDPTLFHKIVAGAAIDANVDARIIARLESSPDHPVTMAFPEGEYLKGLAMIKHQ